MISCRQAKQYEVDLDDYKIIKEIDKGSFSIIYKVKNQKKKKIYAAKVIPTKTKKLKKMVSREILIMMKYAHPTLIGFHGFAYTDFFKGNQITIIMDLMSHGSLERILKEKPEYLKENNTNRQIILVGIAYGMMFLHSNNVIHCDLKPGNVLIDDKFHPHISDFGSSKYFHSNKSKIQSKIYGTTMYMAPELIEDEDCSEKSDVYSFAIIMYQILTGLRPYPLFDQKKIKEIALLQQISEKNLRPTLPETLKNPFRKLIKRCWHKNPKKRPTFEEIFNRLAYNKDCLIYDVFDEENEEDEYEEEEDKRDQSYYLENVDLDKLSEYVKFITKRTNYDDEIESLREQIEIQQQTIEKMKEKIEKNKKSISEQQEKIEEQEKRLEKQESLIKKQNLIIKEKIEDEDDIKSRSPPKKKSITPLPSLSLKSTELLTPPSIKKAVKPPKNTVFKASAFARKQPNKKAIPKPKIVHLTASNSESEEFDFSKKITPKKVALYKKSEDDGKNDDDDDDEKDKSDEKMLKLKGDEYALYKEESKLSERYDEGMGVLRPSESDSYSEESKLSERYDEGMGVLRPLESDSYNEESKLSERYDEATSEEEDIFGELDPYDKNFLNFILAK